MLYELELEISDDKIPFVEEFFKSVPFVKKVKKVTSNEKDNVISSSDFIPEKSAEEIIDNIRRSRSFGHTRVIEPF